MVKIDGGKPVLVTGGSGYVASWVVRYLLEDGNTVRATVRDPQKKKGLEHLHALAEAHPGKLTLHRAELLEPGSFTEAMTDCELVIHTASPFLLGKVKNPQKQLILPALTLSVIYIALIARVTRASVLEALGEDYIRTARAKGLPEFRVLVRHALANAAVPIATVIGIGIAILIGGVVVTESVYAIPGLGRLTVDAVLARDFPTIQGVILFFSFIYVVVNLVIDLSYVVLDPRIRY